MNYFITISTICLLFLTSCTAPFYIPTTHHIPVMRKAGDVKIQANLSVKGPDAQLAYAPIKGLALKGSYAYRFGSTLENYSDYKHHAGDIAIGRFAELSGKWFYSTYIGYGQGQALGTLSESISCDCTSPTTLCNCNAMEESLYQKGFFEGNVDYVNNRIEIGTAFRFSYLNMDQTDTNGAGGVTQRTLQNTFFEPGFVFRVGDEKLKFSTQVGVSIGLGQGNIIHNPFLMSIGLQYSPFGKEE